MIVGVDGCPPIGQANGENRNTPGVFGTVSDNAIVVWKEEAVLVIECGYSYITVHLGATFYSVFAAPEQPSKRGAADTFKI